MAQHLNPKHCSVSIIDSKRAVMDKKHFTAYCLRVTDRHRNVTWDLWRRFSEFFQLRSALLKNYGRRGYQIHNYPFPPKVWFRSRTPSTIASRQHLLERFMNQLLDLEVMFPEVREFLTANHRTRRGTTAITISPRTPARRAAKASSSSSSNSLNSSTSSSDDEDDDHNFNWSPLSQDNSPIDFSEFDARFQADVKKRSNKPQHRALLKKTSTSSDRPLSRRATSDLGRSSNGNARKFLGRSSISAPRRRSFDETITIGSQAGQTILHSQTAAQARRRVSRSLHLETSVQSTLQQSKLAETELAKCVAQYATSNTSSNNKKRNKSTSKDGANTAKADSNSSRPPPAGLGKLKSILGALRSRKLALTEKWERDEKYLSKVPICS
mgnify:CR=1 FL=1